MKNRNNKKGFTLVEVLVVVLIIGILAAIAVPSYNFAVEKTRAKQGIISLTQIAKAQYTYNAKKGNYSDNMFNLPLDMKDSDGSDATGAEFADKFFDYKIFGDEFERARATRNTGEYELSVEYETGQLFCRPIEHKVCQDLNLEEGEELISWPQKVECKPSDYGLKDKDHYCIRTLFKDGTKRDLICTNTNIVCWLYNNDGIRTQQFFPGQDIQNFDPETGEKTTRFVYDANGNLTYFTKMENGLTIERINVGPNSTILSIFDDGTEKDYYSLYYGKTSDTDRIDRYENGKRIYSQYYNSERQLTSVRYYSASGVEAYFTYNPDGTIKSSSCTSGACEGWKPPEISSFQYQTIPDKPQINSCSDNSFEEEVTCGFESGK